MTKTMINGNLGFRADVKANYKPAIVDSFIDDTGVYNWFSLFCIGLMLMLDAKLTH